MEIKLLEQIEEAFKLLTIDELWDVKRLLQKEIRNKYNIYPIPGSNELIETQYPEEDELW